ncbi:bifunctional phosphoribosyl-AMP cyclohydrolase/phosphoribosyl-ATP diphosphatase HisIE [Paenibacillus yanchengensis]|uniref:Histidine biosynthesis bifunctional protein HisIE n=1 Tax=Paenibacillus yanchengensis TaxID=2035833 RepID=A0ABW4YGV7_9BACL
MDIMFEQIKWDAAGLVPVVVQDFQSKAVLMLAYMNRESLQKTIDTGSSWYWSRSRSELWNKGATSGHTQQVKSLSYDCDGDTLLLLVEQVGPACHTGSYTCFTNPIEINADAHPSSSKADRFAMLAKVEEVIATRDAERTEGSYTSYLFDKGLDKILKKVGEEAAEVIIAAKNNDQDELRSESSDLIFHLMVLLRQQGLSLDALMTELENRYGKPTTNKMR